MSEPAYTPEQQQIRVEIDAVTKSLAQDGGGAAYEAEQARELVEKAKLLGMPEEAYADLQRRVEGGRS